jgi:hypothetical protein
MKFVISTLNSFLSDQNVRKKVYLQHNNKKC